MVKLMAERLIVLAATGEAEVPHCRFNWTWTFLAGVHHVLSCVSPQITGGLVHST